MSSDVTCCGYTVNTVNVVKDTFHLRIQIMQIKRATYTQRDQLISLHLTHIHFI